MAIGKRKDLGLLIVAVSGIVFWGSFLFAAGAVVGYFQVNRDDPGPACERLRDYGWDVPHEECVKALTP